MPATADTTVPAAPAIAAARFRLPALPRNEVPGALRAGAGFAAFFGTLWLVQGLRPAGGLPAAALGLLPGVAIAAYLRHTRHTAFRPGASRATGRDAETARRYIRRVTFAEFAISFPGAVAVQFLIGPAAVLPFIILTVGGYLLALAPVIRHPHILAVGTVLAILPLLSTMLLSGTERTLVTGLVGGSVYLTKAIIDLRISRRWLT